MPKGYFDFLVNFFYYKIVSLLHTSYVYEKVGKSKRFIEIKFWSTIFQNNLLFRAVMREIRNLYFKWWVTVKIECYNTLFTAYSY